MNKLDPAPRIVIPAISMGSGNPASVQEDGLTFIPS